ncbi:MAG: hypothetical protein HOA17_06415 [Candidatus Melainabacteria bacterium]|jgi:hypothetical protein|nr:hypothetical protein [Candidatus Melainabacteria bacterium]
MVGRFSPRPPPSSAAQYALSSIKTPILDGHPAGRSFGVAGRAPLVSLPPRVDFIPPIGGARPLGYAGGFSGSGIGSSYSPNDSYEPHDSGPNLSSSESDEETLTDLERLVKEQDKYNKAAEAKKEKLEKEKSILENQSEDYPEDTSEIQEKEDEIQKIEEEQKAYNEKVNETLEKATESINASNKDGEEALTVDQLKEKILNGDTVDIKARVNGLAPESRAELNEMIQAILQKEREEENRNQSKAAQKSLAMSAPPSNIDPNSLDFNTMFS